MQAIQAQLDVEKFAVAEAQRSAANEIRCVRAAALKNFDEQQRELSRAWEEVERERAQVVEQSEELQRLSLAYEAKDRANSERMQSLVEKEKAALESEWVQVKELQRLNREKQAVLEDKLLGLDASQQRMELQEQQRELYVRTHSAIVAVLSFAFKFSRCAPSQVSAGKTSRLVERARVARERGRRAGAAGVPPGHVMRGLGTSLLHVSLDFSLSVAAAQAAAI